MPTPPSTAPVEFYDFIKSAELAHQKHGYDFPFIFDDHFNAGYVFKTPEFFMLASADRKRADAWFVWWAEAHPALRADHRSVIASLLACMPEHRPFVGFAREIRGRRVIKYYSTDRLLKFRRAPRSNA